MKSPEMEKALEICHIFDNNNNVEQKIIQKLEETKYTDSTIVEVKKNKD